MTSADRASPLGCARVPLIDCRPVRDPSGGDCMPDARDDLARNDAIEFGAPDTPEILTTSDREAVVHLTGLAALAGC